MAKTKKELSNIWLNRFQYVRSDARLHNIRQKKMPIFCMIGPPKCGKTTLAGMLAECSDFTLINVRSIVADDISLDSIGVVNTICEEIFTTYDTSSGYILDGFPFTKAQAKLFQHRICRLTLILFITLKLDHYLARMLALFTDIKNFNEIRIVYVKSCNNFKKIQSKYLIKTIQIYAYYPPYYTCEKLLEILEENWNFKFKKGFKKKQWNGIAWQ